MPFPVSSKGVQMKLDLNNPNWQSESPANTLMLNPKCDDTAPWNCVTTTYINWNLVYNDVEVLLWVGFKIY